MLIGYEITIAVLAAFAGLLISVIAGRRAISAELKRNTNVYSLICLAAIVAFFVAFSLAFVHPAEQLYFDENTYQGIALNILNHGNALWCQFGTSYLKTCYVNAIYHDPVAWSVFIAIAFAIFGIGVGTSYGLTLLTGALSIVGVFLLAGELFGNKRAAVLSALVFALMPELFIWSRAQASIDLPFMMFATFAFFFLVLFTRRKTRATLAMFGFSAVLAVFMRVESILLLPLFAFLLLTFSENGIKATAKQRFKRIKRTLFDDPSTLLILLLALVLVFVQINYLSVATTLSYGQGSGQQLVSLGNFMANIKSNAGFFLGQINGINFYPAEFPFAITPIAIAGVIIMVFARGRKGHASAALLLGLWFLLFFCFYTAFYAGSATYGVDVRFMLQLLPQISIFAGFAIAEMADAAAASAKKHGRLRKEAVRYLVLLTATLAFAVYPFVLEAQFVTIPLSKMPQQSVIATSMNVFYSDYSRVPSGCLVFSFTPDIWYEFNRSSAQIGYLEGVNASVKQEIDAYSCKVFDYGYWCVVPPFRNTTCYQDLTHFNLASLATGGAGNAYNITFYRILNYS